MPNKNDRISAYNKRLSKAERKENARKAGIASGEARNKKRLLREALSDFLACPVTSCETAEAVAKQYGIKDDVSIKTLLMCACVLNTMKAGTIKDLVVLVDLLNEKPEAEQDNKLQAIVDALKAV